LETLPDWPPDAAQLARQLRLLAASTIPAAGVVWNLAGSAVILRKTSPVARMAAVPGDPVGRSLV